MNGIKYVTVQGWMSDSLGLEKSTLFVFATIYSFSQGVNICTLGNAEIAAFWNISEKTVRRAKAELLEKGLIEEAEGGIMANKPEGITDDEDVPDPSLDKMSENPEENDDGQNVQADKMSEETDKMSTKADKMSEDNIIKTNKININKITTTNAGAREEDEALIDRWLSFKAERGEALPKTSEKVFIRRARQFISDHGAEAFKELVDYSIGNNYPVIYWDRKPTQSPPAPASSVSPSASHLPPRGEGKAKESIFSSDASYDLQRYAKLGLNVSKRANEFDIFDD